MEILFGGVYMNQKALENAGINYPIKLEYYKEVNEGDFPDTNKAKYGINVVKTEYQNQETKIEQKGIKYFSNDEKRVDYVLETLKENLVTPVALDDVVCDFVKKFIYK